MSGADLPLFKMNIIPVKIFSFFFFLFFFGAERRCGWKWESKDNKDVYSLIIITSNDDNKASFWGESFLMSSKRWVKTESFWLWASQVALVVKNLPANAGNTSDAGLILESGIPWRRAWQPTPWKIPWAEEPGGLQSMGLQRVRHDWAYYGYILLTEKLRHKISHL